VDQMGHRQRQGKIEIASIHLAKPGCWRQHRRAPVIFQQFHSTGQQILEGFQSLAEYGLRAWVFAAARGPAAGARFCWRVGLDRFLEKVRAKR